MTTFPLILLKKQNWTGGIPTTVKYLGLPISVDSPHGKLLQKWSLKTERKYEERDSSIYSQNCEIFHIINTYYQNTAFCHISYN